MTVPASINSSDQAARLAALYQASQSVSASLDLDEALGQALDAALRLTGAERGVAILFDAHGHPEQRLARGAQAEAQAEALDESQWLDYFAAAQAALRDDGPAPFTGYGGEPRAMLAVPLAARGQAAGVLAARSQTVGVLAVDGSAPFEPGAHNLLADFAAPAAAAIANARQYAQAQQAAQRANDARSDFVRTVAHELRIPMTSIKGYADLLKMVGGLTEQQADFVATIQTNVERMSALVSNLSDIARIEAGRLTLEPSDVDLHHLLRESLLNLSNQLGARQQTLHFELPESLPLVRADRARLVQVLTILIVNAHKYSPDGAAITLSAEHQAQQVRISVADAGCGIAPQDQPHIFEQFFRSDEPAIREQTGWGLGLHLARALVEMQNGQITFVSSSGQGSTFVVALPACPIG